MTARDTILGRVRQGVGKDDFAQRKAAAQASLAARSCGPQPVLSGGLVDRFRVKAESLSSTVEAVPDLRAAPAAVARYVAAQHLPPEIVMTPDVASLEWAAAACAVSPVPHRRR